jgi:hypothetical protein
MSPCALASITTLLWNIPSKARTGGAAMADASQVERMNRTIKDATVKRFH